MFFNITEVKIKKWGERGKINKLIKVLINENEGFKKAAINALIKIGQPAVEPLIQVLENRDLLIQRLSAEALGEIGDKRAIKPLIFKLHLSHVSEPAIKSLGKIGDNQALEPLIERYDQLRRDENHDRQRNLYRESYVNERILIIEALGKIGDQGVVPFLTDALLIEQNEDLRQEIDKTLNALGWQPANDNNSVKYYIYKNEWEKCTFVGKPAIKTLIEALYNQNEKLITTAIKALTKIGGPSIDPLINIIKDRQIKTHVKKMAIQALAEIGEPAVAPLISISKDRQNDFEIREDVKWPQPGLRISYGGGLASYILSIIKEPAVDPLINELENPDEYVREWAISTLGNIGNQRAIEFILKALKDEDLQVRKSAIVALGKMGEPAVDVLLSELEKNEALIDIIVYALGLTKSKRVVNTLIYSLKHGEAYVRMQAAIGLGNIGDTRATEPLLEVLEDLDKDVRKEAFMALGKIDGARAAELLIKILKNPKEVYFAIECLKQLHKEGVLSDIHKKNILQLRISGLKAHSDYSQHLDKKVVHKHHTDCYFPAKGHDDQPSVEHVDHPSGKHTDNEFDYRFDF